MNRLREQGWWAIRSPASKGEVDVVAIRTIPYANVDDYAIRVHFYEVKSTAAGPYSHFLPADREALKAEAKKAGADPWLCWWPPRKKPEFIPASDWP